MGDFTNRLIGETSPYLLQHAGNPVDWYPWGEEALQKALTEDKPILVSIGYAACHWCHVMERESFEDETVAQYMNEHFVNIKIDREERPDLDHIYMDALQAMNGQGGWPLNVFLTPQKQPFYGGTYFPPKSIYNRPSWMQVLEGVYRTYQEKKDDVLHQAAQLTQHLQQANSFGLMQRNNLPAADAIFSKEKIDLMANNILAQADDEEGGFGQAPKFPQTFSIQYLLHYYHFTQNETALKQACLSLDKMMKGGIYDQVGGGFARYSTDKEWLVPHFEKMLYDNALLINAYSTAYQLTKNIAYKRVIEETIAFVEKEMKAPEGGYYAAIDADSEGVEGKFYVWDANEIFEVLGADAGMWMEYFSITERGNWEEKNILTIKEDDADFAALYEMELDEFYHQLDIAKAKLYEYRSRRIKPAIDDKLLMGWNALMNIALSNAAAALNRKEYIALAEKHANWMLETFFYEGQWWHSYKEGSRKFTAFLDDYAYLTKAFIKLQEVSGNLKYLETAFLIIEKLQADFVEPETGFFFFTAKSQTDVIIRKKEIYDGATPSGNAVISECLYALGILFDNSAWREQAYVNAMLMHQMANRYPTSFGVWADLIQSLYFGVPEIAVVGEDFAVVRASVLEHCIPYRVMQSASRAVEAYPLLAGKPGGEKSNIYLCKDYSCQRPVNQVDSFIQILESTKIF